MMTLCVFMLLIFVGTFFLFAPEIPPIRRKFPFVDGWPGRIMAAVFGLLLLLIAALFGFLWACSL